MTNKREFDQSATYQIRVKGILDSTWSDWFNGLSITVQGEETRMVGIVADQSALHGMLAKINDLGLLLISVEKL